MTTPYRYTRIIMTTLLLIAPFASGQPEVWNTIEKPQEAIFITSFWAKGDEKTDNRSAIQAAFDYARDHGKFVMIPAGVFAYSWTLEADGISISGEGEKSVFKSLNGREESIVLTGTGWSIRKIYLQGNDRPGRLTTPESGMIWVKQAYNYTIENTHINRSASVGIISTESFSWKIISNSIEHTLADSIHITLVSHDILIKGNHISHSGDDGIAVVSYRNEKLVHNVLIWNNTVSENDWGRWISVVGGERVVIIGNRITWGKADAAGIYISAESEWNTLGVNQVITRNNTLIDAGGAQSGHGAITVYNSVPGFSVANVSLDHNTILDPRSSAVLINGIGAKQVDITGNSLYADKGNFLEKDDPKASITDFDNHVYPSALWNQFK